MSDNIEDYYVTPFELGYDFYIGWKKDDFVGKAALEKMRDGPHRKKVTFEWNPEDVLKVIASALRGGHALQVDRLSAAELCLVLRRPDPEGRQTGRA